MLAVSGSGDTKKMRKAETYSISRIIGKEISESDEK
jgi:hypothetical protein